MKELRREKISENLHRLAAEFVLGEATPASLLTITRVELTESAKVANIYFTTLPESKEDTALKFLERKGGDFMRFVREKSKVGIVPQLRFKIDYGERNRQRLDGIVLE
jgi:ribosome-binding factor A